MFWLSLLVMGLVISIGEGFLHYFPWRLILNGEKLQPPWTYLLGTLAWVVPLSVWLAVYGYIVSAIVMWVAVGAAGVSVLGWYLYDWVVDLVWHKRESIEREQVNGKEG